MHISKALSTLVCLVGLALPAQAGVIYRTQSEGGKKGKVEINEMKVEGLRVRTDQTSGKDRASMIYDGESDTMYMIDHKKKSYMVMDEAAIQQLADQMGQAMKQMEEALAQVPAAQREMMEKMMKERLGAATGGGEPAAEPVIKSLGRNETVAGISCDWKEITRGARTDFKGCIGDPDDLPGGDDLMRVMDDMREFMESLMAALSSSGSFGQMLGRVVQNPMSSMSLVEGFPLVSEVYLNGRLLETSRFIEAEEATVAADEFRPPAGYKRQDMAPSGKGR
jgi:hypothetical protein